MTLTEPKTALAGVRLEISFARSRPSIATFNAVSVPSRSLGRSEFGVMAESCGGEEAQLKLEASCTWAVSSHERIALYAENVGTAQHRQTPSHKYRTRFRSLPDEVNGPLVPRPSFVPGLSRGLSKHSLNLRPFSTFNFWYVDRIT
jgi:hypothetical protein